MIRAALALAVLAAAASGQEEHVLLLEFAGREAGRESYRIERLPEGGRRLSGRSELALGEERLAVDYVLTAGDPGFPWFVEYEVETRFESRERTVRLEVRYEDGRPTIAAGEASAAVEGWPGRGLVLDASAIGPFALALEAFDPAAGGAQDLAVLVPQLGGGMKVTLERRAAEGDLVRWFLAAPAHGVTLWSDAEGRLAGYANPSARLVAWREGATRPGPPPARGEPVAIRTRKGHELAGTFLAPEKPARGAPGVLVLSDAGPHDRRGNPAGSDFRWDHLDQFAAALAEDGAHVLAFDDPEGQDALSDRVADARAALDWLDKKVTGRLAVVGHGEGGLVALELARGRSPVDAVVLLSTPARPFADILLERETAALAERGAAERDLAQYRAGRRAALEKIAESSADELETDAGRLRVRELRERLRFDAVKAVSGLETPVLVLSSASESAEAEIFRRALADARHPSHDVRVLGRVDSLLLPTRFGPADLSDPDRRVPEEALTILGSFLARSLR